MSDRILMKDFNADHAKLEAALTSLAAEGPRLDAALAAETRRTDAAIAAEAKRADAALDSRFTPVIMADATFTGSGTSSMTLPVDGPALGNLLMFSVEIIPTMVGSVHLYLENDHESGASGGYLVCRNAYNRYPVFFFPLRDPTSWAAALSTYKGTSETHKVGRTFQDLTSFGLYIPSGTLKANYRMIIRGIK